MKLSKPVRKELEALRSALYRADYNDGDLFAPDAVFAMAESIRLAKEYQRIQEKHCNGVSTEKHERREAKIEKIITNLIAQLHGLRVEFGGDPRGYTVKLHLANGKLYNTWGGSESGYGIGEV